MDFEAIYRAVFRATTAEPGFTHLTLPPESQIEVALAELREGLERVHGRPLVTVHELAFDQQVSTRFHQDGGPDRSFLLLGYAPSPVASTIRIADHVRAAEAQGKTARSFLQELSPLNPEFERVTAPYTTTLQAFDSRLPQLVLINNSIETGVLHQASIPEPDPTQARRIVSWMLTFPD